MKKSALLLSTLVVISSVTPVVAMNRGQEERPSRIQQVINDLLDLRDNAIAAMGNLGELRTNLSGFHNAVNGLAGDRKEENANNESGAMGIVNGVARGLRNNLRNANIPGMEKVVNDDDMTLIKLGVIGLSMYVALRVIINTLPKAEDAQTARNRARNNARRPAPARMRRAA